MQQAPAWSEICCACAEHNDALSQVTSPFLLMEQAMHELEELADAVC